MEATRYGYLAFGVLVALAVFAMLFVAWREEARDCEVRWQASSIQVIDGKQSKPHVTQGCGKPGKEKP